MSKPVFGRPPRKKKRTSHLEERIAFYLEAKRLPVAVREFRFAPPRLFRFDFAWPARGIALEVDGGIWTGGRHGRGADFAIDAEKQNLAASRGWLVFRVTTRQLEDGSAFQLLDDVLGREIRYTPDVLTEANV